MRLHAFVDESYRHEDTLCAVVVESDHVSATRRAMSALLRGNQRRIHMAKESRVHRKTIVDRVATLHIRAVAVSTSTARRSRRASRNVALSELTDILWRCGVGRLIIESCDQDTEDRQVVGDRLARLGRVRDMDVHHLRPNEDPLLWLPDIVAWVVGNADPSWADAKRALSVERHRA